MGFWKGIQIFGISVINQRIPFRLLYPGLFLESWKWTTNRAIRIQWKWCSMLLEARSLRNFTVSAWSTAIQDIQPLWLLNCEVAQASHWDRGHIDRDDHSALGYSRHPSSGSWHVHSVFATIWLYKVNCVKDSKWQPASQAHQIPELY